MKKTGLEKMELMIREYQPQDIGEIIKLFYDTVHTVNACDYTTEQLNVWAGDNIDSAAWNMSLLSNFALVAVADSIIVGFGDIDDSGYLDRLYVHRDYQHQGIATQLCDCLEKHAISKKIITHASITALPFFICRGYQIVKEQQVERKGIKLTNYVMKK